MMLAEVTTDALPPPWMLGFFVALLLAIAVFPLIPSLARWWGPNRNKLALAVLLSMCPLGWAVASDASIIAEVARDYTSFMMLLASLFYVSGGIYVAGDLRPTPALNTSILALGSACASLIGTTGASMLFIRPLLHANASRRFKRHTVVFFIFLVSNIGGALLPLGDPPLFLAYLAGVPFFWTLSLWPQQLLIVAILLGLFVIVDRHHYRREQLELGPARSRLHVEGKINSLWLAGIVAAVATIGSEHGLLREAAMLGCMVGSHLSTGPGIRERNEFEWAPMLEVAALFLGIFVTLIPARLLLEAHGAQLGLSSPAEFFWITGVLSSFLDNSPTFLVFFSAAKGMTAQGLLDGALVEPVAIPATILAAIACGAVFMGAMSYIGNGPNFMVKAIAERAGVEMPSFFGYMKWSCAILLPCFVLVTLLFFNQ